MENVESKICEAIDKFEYEKGVSANALILGVDIISELITLPYKLYRTNEEKTYFKGFEVIFVNFEEPDLIKPLLL